MRRTELMKYFQHQIGGENLCPRKMKQVTFFEATKEGMKMYICTNNTRLEDITLAVREASVSRHHVEKIKSRHPPPFQNTQYDSTVMVRGVSGSSI